MSRPERRRKDSAAKAIGRVLNVEFRPHESSFYGGAYCRAETPQGTMLIQPNLDQLDDEPFEKNWQTDHALLYLEGPKDDAGAPYVEAICSDQCLNVTEL
jgi:hypothetical protein